MKPPKLLPLIVLGCCLVTLWSQEAGAFWVWSPETGKWTNPKNEAKDTPDEQFRWAMAFYQDQDYKRAIDEFKKLIKTFPNTKWAAEGQFFLGLCYESLGDIGKAAESFRVSVDRYPYSERANDAIEHEYDLAEDMLQGKKTKILGMEIMPAVDIAVSLYEHIVRVAPYGPYGVKAQYRLGEAYVVLGEWEQAERAYQAVVDEYPNSEYAPKAKYQMARVSYRASVQQEYHLAAADQAIEKFEGFKSSYPDSTLRFEANEVISELRHKKAQSFYDTGTFYQQRRKYKSARIYFRDILRQFPDTPSAELARKRLDEISSVEEGKKNPKKPWWKLF